jgi:hypothetical protein
MIVAVIYALLALVIYQFVFPTPAKQTWEHRYSGSVMQTADSQVLQSHLNSAVISLETLRHDKHELQLIILVAALGIVGFHGWSLFMINRLKKEDLICRAS